MSQRRFKILIADDSPINQEFLRAMLASENEASVVAGQAPYIAEFAKTGSEVFEKASSFEPDLILLDIVSPELRGFDVLVNLKESDATRPIPVITMVNPDDEASEERGFLRGAADSITKPYHKAAILARIRTQRQIAEQMRIIELHSLIDPLTGLPNRRSFDTRIEEVWGLAARHKDPVSVLMIDIDHFRMFNEKYGHNQGDIVLKSVANAISMSLLRSSDMAYRWDGDLFSAVLVGSSLFGALLVAERIREKVENTAVADVNGGNQRNVTVSIGGACETPKKNIKITDLIKQADMSLYAAKGAGRNNVQPARR